MSPEESPGPRQRAIEAMGESWWVSWYFAGMFEYHGPWWVSGFEAGGAGRDTIVAAVKATDEGAARQVVAEAHDDPSVPIEWRFVDHRPPSWDPFASDRFPRADWMEWPSCP